MKLGWILLPKPQYPIEISCGSLPVTDLQIAGLPEYIRVTFFFFVFRNYSESEPFINIDGRLVIVTLHYVYYFEYWNIYCPTFNRIVINEEYITRITP